ncbi:PREDICTED: kinesin-like protein KIF11-B [Priapulus caudatus]|uniref:Kinesin-like protein n=1 Tax=Priapulus caudatus TaxID=37621 RepID=A0ABM1E7J6_PRICU|nr:PREDICTED: kinesin-like protein KIF11-B [Priapulus caudatus]
MGSKDKKQEKNQNIHVAVRCRPLSLQEKKQGSHSIASINNEKREVYMKERANTKTFTFDQVFGPEAEQVDIYKSVVMPVVEEVLMGYNCTMFAYGQTGSGKTYTMEGERTAEQHISWDKDPLAGIIPRSVHQIFDTLTKQDVEFSMRVSFLELYNEELFDLLSSSDNGQRMRIFEDSAKKGSVVIQGLEEIAVMNKDEVYNIMERGAMKRQTAATLMNASSSRSHSVFSITIHIKENTVDGEELLKTGKLNLVDLAGSENIGRSGAIDKRAREAGNINQSLLSLGRVITALFLTHYIADQSLMYCYIFQEYTEEIEKLRKDLIAAREKNGIYLAEENYMDITSRLETQAAVIKELEDNIGALTDEITKVSKIFTETQSKLDEKTKTLDYTTDQLCSTQRVGEELAESSRVDSEFFNVRWPTYTRQCHATEVQFSESYASALKTAAKGVGEKIEMMKSAEHIAETKSSEGQECVSALEHDSTQRWTDMNTSLTSSVDALKKDLNAQTNKLNGCSEASVKEVARGKERLEGALTQHLSEHCQQVAAQMQNEVSLQVALLDQTESNVQQELEMRKEQLDTFLADELKVDIPTGTTPQRRDFAYPRTLSRTQPHDQLLQTYRASVDVSDAMNVSQARVLPLPEDTFVEEEDQENVNQQSLDKTGNSSNLDVSDNILACKSHHTNAARTSKLPLRNNN